MRSIVLLLCCTLSACGPADRGTDAPRTTSDPRAAAAVAAWARRLDTLAVRVDSLRAAVATLPDQPARAQAAFADARDAYKRVEAFTEYFLPTVADQLNGPPVPDAEEDAPEIVVPPDGFQVVEAGLFPAVATDPAALDTLRGEVRIVRDLVERTRRYAGALVATDAQIFDALRLQLARLAVLGVTGFDSPAALRGLRETDVALAALLEDLAPYRDTLTAVGRWQPIETAIASARSATAAASFDAFDRLGFLAGHLIPLARQVVAARDAVGVGPVPSRSPFRAAAASPFDVDAFDPEALRPAWAPPASPARVALGEALLADPRLSDAGDRACTSCHLPDRAFTDGLARSAARDGRTALRNAPTLFNVALQGAQFADGRATFLEDQVTDVVTNPAEMHGTFTAIVARLRADSGMRARFATAFAGTPEAEGTDLAVRSALAAYLRSLTRLDTRVDRALRGDTAALTAEERLGFNVFTGKGKCATCHFLPLTNGFVPPAYLKHEVEVIGVPARAVWAAATVDPDTGRQAVTRSRVHRFAFKTPTVRFAARTAPYMHNGVYRTLDEVVRFYDVGGGGGIGIDLPNQTLPFDRLNLTEREKRALVAVMRAWGD